ncbi:MAG TPA: Flp pilus assembly protein CpaB [Stellaceae bacterium]|nr:Flp pilus assembly protein CpaB [Stellaceae bacterium]
MRARTVSLLFIALLLAGGTTMMARVWLNSQRVATQEAAPIVVPLPTKSVLVARSNIQRGQILRPDDFAWQQWPEAGIDKNYVLLGSRTPETYAGWVARQPIDAGEPLIEAKIVAPGNRGFLAAVLHPGMRAVSVPVTVTSGISGFVFPGDQVDLIVTYSVQDRAAPGQQNAGPQLEHKVSETVLTDVRVIAMDQKLDSKAGEAAVAKTATFEVTPKQSEIIALANEMGKLSLSLRSLVPGPDEIKVSDATTIKASANATPSPPRSETYTVDSDVSPLLPSPGGSPAGSGSGGGSEGVTVLRGGQSTATSAVQK